MNNLIAFIVPILMALMFLNSCGHNPLQGPQGAPGAAGGAGAQGQPGVAGTPAVLSSGPIGASNGNSMSACHHDYMFLSNNWLLLRHQKNGTADQGVGSTGFDVWNSDISDFELVSEVGNVEYCSLHFDETNWTLSYTVVYNGDGKRGETGTINLLTGLVSQ